MYKLISQPKTVQRQIDRIINKIPQYKKQLATELVMGFDGQLKVYLKEMVPTLTQSAREGYSKMQLAPYIIQSITDENKWVKDTIRLSRVQSLGANPYQFMLDEWNDRPIKAAEAHKEKVLEVVDFVKSTRPIYTF